MSVSEREIWKTIKHEWVSERQKSIKRLLMRRYESPRCVSGWMGRVVCLSTLINCSLIAVKVALINIFSRISRGEMKQKLLRRVPVEKSWHNSLLLSAFLFSQLFWQLKLSSRKSIAGHGSSAQSPQFSAFPSTERHELEKKPFEAKFETRKRQILKYFRRITSKHSN